MAPSCNCARANIPPLGIRLAVERSVVRSDSPGDDLWSCIRRHTGATGRPFARVSCYRPDTTKPNPGDLRRRLPRGPTLSYEGFSSGKVGSGSSRFGLLICCTGSKPVPGGSNPPLRQTVEAIDVRPSLGCVRRDRPQAPGFPRCAWRSGTKKARSPRVLLPGRPQRVRESPSLEYVRVLTRSTAGLSSRACR